MRCAGHVARTGENTNPYRILVGKLERRRDHLYNVGIDGRIILNGHYRSIMGWGWTGLMWLRIGRDVWGAGVNTVMNLGVL
jgi:hypothetical protein